MFYELNSIIEIDLSNFDSSKVTNMKEMFSNCKKLIKITFGNINTSLVENMIKLFYHCEALTSIDLSHFDTSSVTTMEEMFSNCKAIKILDASTFNTSKVNIMYDLLAYCEQLMTVNLSSFDTINVKRMQGMFMHDSNLKYLDLKNFKASSLNNIGYMFNGCSKLVYINLRSFKIINQDIWKVDAFNSIIDTKICIEDGDTIEFLSDKININYINCSDICFQNNTEFDSEQNKCKKKEVKFEDKLSTIIYEDKPKNNYLTSNIINIPETNQIINNSTHTNIIATTFYESIKENNYLSSNNNITYTNVIYPELIIEETYIINQDNFTKEIQDYLMNNFQSITKNNYSIFTNGDVTYTLSTTTYQKNNRNSNVTTVDLSDCEDKLKIQYDIPKDDELYILKIDKYLDGLNIPKIEYEIYYPFSPNNLTKLDMSICKNVKINIAIPININPSDINIYNKSSDFYNDICYTLKTECGTDKSLKDRRNDFVDNSMSLCEEDCDLIEYDINIKKAICSCYTKVQLPLISEIKFDKEKLISNFKNISNIANFEMLKCYHLLFDLKYFLKNIANYITIILLIVSIIAIFLFVCKNYEEIKKIITKIKQEIKRNENNIKIKTKINNSNKSKRKNNIFNKDKNKNKKRNKKKKKKKNKIINKDKNKNKKGNKNLFSVNKKNKKLKSSFKNDIFGNTNINFNSANIDNKKILKKEIKQTNPKQRNINKNNLTNKNNTNNSNLKLTTNNSILKVDNSTTYNDIEINSFKYEKALKKDFRTYCQYYLSLLRTKHILIKPFYYSRDYNARIIKIYIFLLTFTINFVVSAMFYGETLIHKIYIDEGSFDFTYQLPQMFYSFLISTILQMLLEILGLYEKSIISLKNTKELIDIKSKEILRNIKCKIIFFFLINYILIIFYWFYLGCFCAVYKNTQIHLLIEVSSSFSISFITPFFINLIPGVFRITALKNRKNKKEYLYKFSQLLEML